VFTLANHLNYLRSADPHSKNIWGLHGPRCHELLWRLEQSVDGLVSQNIDWGHAHRLAVGNVASVLSAIPDYDYSTVPRPEQWIRRVQPRIASSVYAHWQCRLTKFFRHADSAGSLWYGGIKNPCAVQSRIAIWRNRMFRDAGLLDVWDTARTRIVVPCLVTLSELVSRLFQEMGPAIVRCRNYYKRPRDGSLDPYRAIHLELQLDSEDFVELQLVSARREAVGHADHALVHKRRLPFLGWRHRLWLRRLSWCANLLDLLSDPHHTTVSLPALPA
jgi:hypothetical protein